MRFFHHFSVTLFCSLSSFACGDTQSTCSGAACAGTGGVSPNGGAGGTSVGSSTGGTIATSAGGAATGGAATGGSNTGGAGTGGTATGGTKTGSGGVTGVGGSAGGTTAATGGVTAQACPNSSDYVGNAAWPDQLVVTSGATYCGAFKEIRNPNLEHEYAAKAKLTIVPGTYRLSNTAGTYDFSLPVCFERLAGVPVPSFAGAGQVKTIPSASTVSTYRSNGHTASQPLRSAASGTWSFSMRLSYWTWSGTPAPPVLDGSVLDTYSTTGNTPGYANQLELCDGTACDDQWEDVKFEACNPTTYPLNRHTITFDSEQVALDVRITGEVSVAEMIGAFTAASGTLDGTAFTQTDYWDLVYSADHHHFIRNFAVLFDAPIGGACGLKVLNFVGNNPGGSLPEVNTINCDLSNIAARTVTNAVLELL
jgi:hypothetical protein